MNATTDPQSQEKEEKPESCPTSSATQSESSISCPMAAAFQQSLGTYKFCYLLLIPALLLILVGVLIIFEPTILVWFVAATCVVLGLAMIAMAICLKRCSTRIQACAGDYG